MEHNEFKDQLYEVLDENDVALGIEDIDTSDAANIFTTINEQNQNIAQKKDTLCRRMYN